MKIVQIEAGNQCLYALDNTGGIWSYDSHLGWIKIESPFKQEPKERPLKHEGEPEGFEAFYDAYPRRDARRAAAISFARALKRHPSYSPEDVAAAAGLYAQQVKAEGREKQFIPMPATWLNQDRFREFFDE